jgi:predicted solute-binding protein
MYVNTIIPHYVALYGLPILLHSDAEHVASLNACPSAMNALSNTGRITKAMISICSKVKLGVPVTVAILQS